MGVGEIDVSDESKASLISCSVCLDHVIDNGDRSWAKLQCGHQFHLDCIGSAFNIKGVMQCPNCRKIEKGQWLFASASRSFPDVSMDDWVQDEDLYDLTLSHMAIRPHNCPYYGLTRFLSFDEADYPIEAYLDHHINQHAIYEPSSAPHPSPYIAYVGPVHPSSSSFGGTVQDSSSTYNNHWNNGSGPSDVAASYAAAAYPTMEVHHYTWEQNAMPNFSSSSRVGGGADQPSVPNVTHRQRRTTSDASRSGNFMHHFPMGHSPAARTGSSVTSSMNNPPHPGSVARARDRANALEAYNSPPVRPPVVSNSRRSTNHRGFPQAGPTASSSSDQSGGYYYFPSASSNGRNSLDNESHSLSNHYHSWERDHYQNFFSFSQIDRDPIWGPLPRPRRASDRMQSQNR